MNDNEEIIIQSVGKDRLGNKTTYVFTKGDLEKLKKKVMEQPGLMQDFKNYIKK